MRRRFLDRVPRRSQQHEPPPPPPEPAPSSGGEGDDGEGDELPIVPFVPVRCPRCKATKPITDGIYKPLRRRYHLCQDCGRKFLSVELDPGDLETPLDAAR